MKRARALAVVAVLAVLIATLWPFNPFPRNSVTWLQGTNGVKFNKSGLIVSKGPLTPPDGDAESYSVELLLRPASAHSVYTILSIYSPNRPKQFAVRQWNDGLIVMHDASVKHDRTKTIEFDVDQVFDPRRVTLVTISSGSKGTIVYLDGQPVGSFPGFKISRSELAGELVLGTSSVSYQPWRGELRGLAVYSKELTVADAVRHYREWTKGNGLPPDLDRAMVSYSFSEGTGGEVGNAVASGPNLQVPPTFSVPHKLLLESPAKEFRPDWQYAGDVVSNIAGFVPLGLIVCAYFACTKSLWKAIFITTLACGILSFGIEVLQYFIPPRGSGVTDIITNTLGALLGAALAQAVPVRRALRWMKLMQVPEMPFTAPRADVEESLIIRETK
jgi:VanZ family protein